MTCCYVKKVGAISCICPFPTGLCVVVVYVHLDIAGCLESVHSNVQLYTSLLLLHSWNNRI